MKVKNSNINKRTAPKQDRREELMAKNKSAYEIYIWNKYGWPG